MNVSNVGRQCKRKPRLLARILAALIAFLQIGFSPVMVSAGSVSAKNGTKEPSPKMQMNGALGESSSELLGSHKAVTKGGSVAQTTPVVSDVDSEEVETQNMGSKTLAHGDYLLTSEADHVFINGATVTDAADGHSFTVSSGSVIQIITQTGLEAPYITVIKG